MEKKIVNPWTWQDQFGFVQANDIIGAKRHVFFSGQVSVDNEGNPIHAGDMAGQIHQVFDNLETRIVAGITTAIGTGTCAPAAFVGFDSRESRGGFV